MKYSMVILSIFFTSNLLSMHRSINVENKGNQVVLIAYRELGGSVIEKIPPHQSLMLFSTTPFLAVRNQDKLSRFSMQHRRYHFVITEKNIEEYNDRNIFIT